MLHLSKALNAGLATLSFLYAPRRFKGVALGVEGGLIPRSIFVRYTYPDGQESLDKAHFTGSFVGFSARYTPQWVRASRWAPYVGTTAAIPMQFHLMAGVAYHLGADVSLGIEGRYAYCPTRRQEFNHQIRYRMNRVCDYAYSAGFTIGYSLK